MKSNTTGSKGHDAQIVSRRTTQKTVPNKRNRLKKGIENTKATGTSCLFLFLIINKNGRDR